MQMDPTACRETRAGEICVEHDLSRLNLNRNDTHLRHSMHVAGLATAACLVFHVSGAAVFRYADGAPSRKRQGHLLDDVGLVVSETTRTPVYLPAITSTPIVIPLTPHDATATINPFFPNIGGILFPPDGPVATSTSASSVISSTSSSTPTRTHTSSSTKSAAVLPTPPATLAVSPPTVSTVPDTTSWKPIASPSSTSSAVPTSAASTNTWKTVGIAVSVVTLIGLTILLVVFYEQWTAFVRDVFLCRRSRRGRDPLGDEEFLPDKHYENHDTSIRSHNRTWAREIRESARLSNIRYPTGVFYGDGSTLGPGKAGIGAGSAGRGGVGVGEFGQFDRPSRPSFLQRLSMLSPRSPSPVSPRLRMKSHSPGVGNTGDGFVAPTLTPPNMPAF